VLTQRTSPTEDDVHESGRDCEERPIRGLIKRPVATTFELDLITLHFQLRMIITLSQGPYMQNLKHNLE